MKIDDELKAKIDRLTALEALTDYLDFTAPEEHYAEMRQLRKEILPQVGEFVKALVNAQLITFVLEDENDELPHESMIFAPKLCVAQEDGIYVHADVNDHMCDEEEVEPAKKATDDMN